MKFIKLHQDTTCNCIENTIQDTITFFARKINLIIMKTIEIVSEYKVLHFDEYPILFIGKNATKHNVVGSFLYENDGNNTLTFFHSIVDNDVLHDFFQQKISYLELLKKAQSIYEVEKTTLT